MTISTSSETWQTIEKWAKAEIENARGELERYPRPPGADDIERGRIRALRDLLALAAPRPGKPDVPQVPNY